MLRFAGETGVADTPPLAAGVYETHTAGGDGLLAVNASAEWLPRRPTVRSGAVGSAPAADRAPRARTLWWLYALALACARARSGCCAARSACGERRGQSRSA